MCDHQALNVAYLPTIPGEYAFVCTMESLIESINKKVLEIYNKAALDEFITFFNSGLAGICIVHGIERNKPKDSNHLQNLSDGHILRQAFTGWNMAHEVVDLELYTRRTIDLFLLIKEKINETSLEDIPPSTQNNIQLLISFLEVLQAHSQKGQLPDSNDDE